MRTFDKADLTIQCLISIKKKIEEEEEGEEYHHRSELDRAETAAACGIAHR